MLDPEQGCVWNVPRPRKVGAPGPSPAKLGGPRLPLRPLNLPQSHGDHLFAGDFSTHSRSSLKMKGFEPSINLDFENGFFEKGCQLNNYFFGTFLPSSRWSQDIVKMKGFELAATFGATSDFQNFFWGALWAPEDPDKRGKRSVLPPSLRGRLAEQDSFIFARDYEPPRPLAL